MKKDRKNEGGFTLIELLVSITIVAILATIGLTMYSGAQKSAKIAKRTEDLRAVKNALEVYYSVNKKYPNTNGAWYSECSNVGATPKEADGVIPNLVPKYMNAIPSDPSMDTTDGTSCYMYKSDEIDYKFIDYKIADFSNSQDYESQKSLIDPKRDGADSVSDCLVDGSNITAWAIWSSCDPDKCSETESSCSW